MNIKSFNEKGEPIGEFVTDKGANGGTITLNDAGRETFSTIIIPLEPRTKKNSQQIRKNHATGKQFVAPSNTFLVYQNQCFPYLYHLRSNAESLQYPLNIKCLFYMPTHRRVDLVNLLEAIDDVLVHYKLIVDDCAAYIGGHDGSRVLYDKDNPRTEIYISPLDGGVCSEVIKSKCDQCKNKNNHNRIDPCFSCKYDDSLNDNYKPINDAAESSEV